MPFYLAKRSGPWEHRWALWAITFIFSVAIAVCVANGRAFETPCRVRDTVCTGCCTVPAGDSCAGAWKLELNFRTPKFGRQNGTLAVDCVGRTIKDSSEPCIAATLQPGEEFTCYIRDRQPQLHQSLSATAIVLIVALAVAIVGCDAYNIRMARRLGVSLCFCGKDDEEKARSYATDRKAAVLKDAADQLSEQEAEQRAARKKKQEGREKDGNEVDGDSPAGDERV
eukprot:PLAT9944.1.p2 GENE.PLAT9944.1~~PLAT9944.1.p2  ORF type:complete len:226 (-),score=36.57 PLAT9944.1:306-983(-)